MTKRFTLDETFMITDNECMEIINPLMNSKDVATVCDKLNDLDEQLMDCQTENSTNKLVLNDLENTIQELYDFRLVLNALLFNEWAKTGEYEVYKSKKHHDGEVCFDGEWFIVVAILPSGQVTNHYHMKYWDYFKIPSYERVKDEFDGHTSSVVLLRYGVLLE